MNQLRARLVLASRFENIEVAERAFRDLCSEAGCDGDELYWVVTALREALANAVRHGNRLEPERKVHVEYRVDGCQVTIQIEDEGDGFDVSAVPDPTSPENLLRPSGRGIFYMQQFMTRVEFGRSPGGGTTVRMVKKLQPTTKESGQ
jgi:serine/threonine-protein kinase RsbW